MSSEAMPCHRTRRARLKSTAAPILGLDQQGLSIGDGHDLQQWKQDADQIAAAARTVLGWTDAFERVRKMQDPLTAVSELADTLLMLDLRDASEARVVHRLATLINVQVDAAQYLRGDLFKMAHKESRASEALDGEVETWRNRKDQL
ncbi:MAG TPA: hypothetical protein VIL30_20280 [Ramlibacter sp.]